MDVLGWVLLIVLGILLVAILVMVGLSVPDIARYLRIKRL